jgi:hypothetical protein
MKKIKNQAATLRSYIAKIFGLSAPERIILTPGSLIALRLAFATIGVRRLALGKGEYYSAEHFPDLTIIKNIDSSSRLSKGSVAVLKSLVTWRGALENAPFKDMSPVTYLRVLDASHAGAAGFPVLDDLSTDLVIGNPGHWLGLGASKENLGFLYVPNPTLWAKLSSCFRMFYLAVEGEDIIYRARWIAPVVLTKTVRWLSQHRINRARVQEQHTTNLALASRLSTLLQLAKPTSALLWSNELLRHRSLAPLRRAGLVWHPPDGGTRIMCRADLLTNKRR